MVFANFHLVEILANVLSLLAHCQTPVGVTNQVASTRSNMLTLP
jgi:hypothetical protein